MTRPNRVKTWTADEFLALDLTGPVRWQLIGGEILDMTEALEVHGGLVSALTFLLAGQVKPPCRVIGEAGIRFPHAADRFYIADLAITCASPEPKRRAVEAPVVIAEVLSPSTRTVDLHDKLPDYLALPSVCAVILVDAERRAVIVHARVADGWRSFEHSAGTADLGWLDLSLDLDRLYRDSGL